MTIDDLKKPPLDELVHYGKKGMHWGVRKKYEPFEQGPLAREEIKLKNGDSLIISENHTPAFAKFLSRYLPKVKTNLENSKSFQIEHDGKPIGEADFYKESKTSLNLVWFTIDDNARGKGYGTAVIKSAVQYAKQTGMKELTLEVPGTSPDARHIYEKFGFEAVGTLGNKDDAWGGLTKMRMTL